MNAPESAWEQVAASKQACIDLRDAEILTLVKENLRLKERLENIREYAGSPLGAEEGLKK